MYNSRVINNLLQTIYQKINLINEYRPINKIALDKLQEEMSYREIYNTNAIEGNRFTERETYMVLKEQLVVNKYTLREHLELSNTNVALQYIDTLLNSKEPITLATIQSIHYYLTHGLLPIQDCGAFRDGDVTITYSNHTPSSADRIEVLLQDALDDYYKSPTDILGIIRFHHKFTNIHPFFDGNGRSARLITNLMLLQCGYIPVIIRSTTKQEYYECLEYADLYYDYRKLYSYFLGELNATCDLYLRKMNVQL